MFKAGQTCRIKKFSMDLSSVDWSEKVTIRRWRKINGDPDGPISPKTGWNVVEFSDGGQLLCHDSRLMPSNEPSA